MKKLIVVLSLLAVKLCAQQVPTIPFVIVPVGPEATWAANQVYQREILINTNLASLTLSNYIRNWFVMSITNTTAFERNLARQQLQSAFATSTNKTAILQAAGISTNSVSPVDTQ